MKQTNFTIPLRIALKQYTAMLAGIILFCIIVVIIVSIVFTAGSFLFGNRNLFGLLIVAIGTFALSFVGYILSELTRKKERFLRQFLLLRHTGCDFFERGEYNKAVDYLQESIRVLQLRQDTVYNNLLEQATDELRYALERQAQA